MPDRWMRNAIAEAIGAFALVFVGVLVVSTSAGNLTAIALAHGLTIAVAVAALAHVSGGHFNPAITLAMYLSKAIDLRGALTYWAAQLIGGVLAALLVLAATDQDVVAAGAPAVADGVGVVWAILLEAVATFVLVLVVYGTVMDARAPFSAYPFAIGFAVAVGIFAIGPLTGGALNPARGFGPALVGGEWGATAAWLIGPMVGGVLAWAVYEYVISPREKEPSIEGSDGTDEREEALASASLPTEPTLAASVPPAPAVPVAPEAQPAPEAAPEPSTESDPAPQVTSVAARRAGLAKARAQSGQSAAPKKEPADGESEVETDDTDAATEDTAAVDMPEGEAPDGDVPARDEVDGDADVSADSTQSHSAGSPK